MAVYKKYFGVHPKPGDASNSGSAADDQARKTGSQVLAALGDVLTQLAKDKTPAQAQGLPKNERDWPCGIEMVQVPGKSFLIGKYEVTQGQWKLVMGENPSHFQKGDTYPVENVTWNEALRFDWKLGAQTGRNYRLPTELEWEYACRAGATDTRQGDLYDIAWFAENSRGSTQPVGKKRPNMLGLFDTLGNVWEWCQDPYDPRVGSRRSIRGGCWVNSGENIRAAFRFGYGPDFHDDRIGLRVACEKW